MRVRPRVVVGFMGVWLAAAVAGADDTHYRGIPIGAHAIQLGGAFTGVADDVSAAYFNPGGLALGGKVGIAAGLTVNAWERDEIQRAIEQDEGNATATTKTSRTVPIFVGAAIQLGPKDRRGERKYTLGVSVVEPIFSTGGVLVKLRSDLIELSDTYRVNSSDRGTWYGLSFAGRINARHALGGSLYLSVRKLNHSETGVLLSGGTPIPDQMGAFIGTNTAVNTQSLSFKAFHFVPRFGWIGQLKPQLRFGAMLQLPGIPLKQTVDALSQGFINQSTDPATPTVTEAYYYDQRVGAHLPIPLELELGLQYWPAEKVMLALDASFHAPVRSGTRADTTADVPIGGAFFDNDTGRTAAGNVALGGDFFIGKYVVIEVGFFTDISSALKVPADPTRYYNPRINRFGGTLSVGFDVGGVALAVGSTVLYGKGDATGVMISLDSITADYTRTQATSRIVYLHVTGATRAAEDVSKLTTGKIRDRRKRKKKKGQTATEGETEQQDAEVTEKPAEPPQSP